MKINSILSTEDLYSKKIAYFSTPQHSILGIKHSTTINVPANDWNKLHKNIEKCFTNIINHNNSDRKKNPILIGCIPFDTNEACTLHFYENYLESNSNIFSDVINTEIPKLIKTERLIDAGKFKDTVRKCLTRLESAELEKIVLSQSVDCFFDKPIEPKFFIKSLLQKNPNAYNFIVPLQNCSFIFGASPELLLSKQDVSIHSNPLAGSRPKSNDINYNNAIKQQLSISQKDQNEHNLVVKSILKKLQPICNNLTLNNTPEILETSTMLHLSTNFHGTLEDKSMSALEIALMLHPTPAICGTPTKLSKEIILNEEGYNREYYTGIVGWMDSKGNGEWVVTIRCGLVNSCKLRLYAGAGIVENSNADDEWQETEDKMKTLLNLFK